MALRAAPQGRARGGPRGPREAARQEQDLAGRRRPVARRSSAGERAGGRLLERNGAGARLRRHARPGRDPRCPARRGTDAGVHATDHPVRGLRPSRCLLARAHLLWRATRILLDVGLHTRGMTFEQAVEHMTTHLRVDRANAEAEVRRYCAEPAQPLCYAVGRREIVELRKDFRAAQGKAFTLRRFHDALLRYGGLPVTLIRWGLGLNA